MINPDVFHLFLKGLVVGLGIAAPVGPVGILCLRRSLQEGRLYGFISGLGAASADAVYGLLAALGLTWLTSALLGMKDWLGIGGGLFICALGIKYFFTPASRPRPEKSSSPSPGNLLTAWSSTFIITLTNPLTMLAFAAVFAGLGLVSAGDSQGISCLWLVGGVFLGSAAWWGFLSSLAGLFRRRLDQKGLTWVNRGAGVLLVGMGAALLWGILVQAY